MYKIDVSAGKDMNIPGPIRPHDNILYTDTYMGYKIGDRYVHRDGPTGIIKYFFIDNHEVCYRSEAGMWGQVECLVKNTNSI